MNRYTRRLLKRRPDLAAKFAVRSEPDRIARPANWYNRHKPTTIVVPGAVITVPAT